MRISTSSPTPFAFAVTMPPPAEASDDLLARLLLRLDHLLLHLLRLLHQRVHVHLHVRLLNLRGVERVLEQGEEVVLGRRLVSSGRRGTRLADRRRDREPSAGDLVQRLAQHDEVALLLGLAPVEVGRRRELDRQRVVRRARPGAPRRAASRSGSIARARRGGRCAPTLPAPARAGAARRARSPSSAGSGSACGRRRACRGRGDGGGGPRHRGYRPGMKPFF